MEKISPSYWLLLLALLLLWHIWDGSWYRFMGAGEQMATLAEQGSSHPTVVTSVIVGILLIWSLYGLSGAKVIGKLPFVRIVLVLVSTVLLMRAAAFYWLMPMFPENSLLFWWVSSGICLIFGLLYAIGLYQSWEQLGSKQAD